MSEHTDQASGPSPGHLIERAAARLKQAGTPAAIPGMVDRPGVPAATAWADPHDGQAPPLPPTHVPGFKPLVIPPPVPILPDTFRGAPAPHQPMLQPVPPAPEPTAVPVPASFGNAVAEGAASPLPASAARPAQSGARLPGMVPALSTGPSFTRPAPGGTPLTVSSAGARVASGSLLPAPPVIQLDALERAGMVVARTTRTRISEEYRIAIGRILRTLHESEAAAAARNVLMVTSARPGEGKSFTALNLAGSIAQNGTDAVLLVDVDPKVKPLSDQLGLGEALGFLDLVSDPSLRPEDLLHVTAIPNLAIMPVGTRLGGAAQTIGGTASMRPIIPTVTRLARRFPKHLIMLDAPPCLSTSDPHTLAPHVGQIVLVVEAERTQRSEVEAAVDLVRVCPSITMLLNKVRMTTSHTFGAYDYFGSYT